MTDMPHLVSRIYGTPLLIARPKLEVILGVVGQKLAGNSLPTLAAATADSMANSAMQIVDGIAVIPIFGTLVRRSSYLAAASGLTSYHAIEAMAENAFADPAINAVLLEVDSSGGEAGGVFDLALRLSALAKASGKPLWAIADESALSAAYALACVADRLWLTRTAEAGSIGVVAVHVDESAADAKAGLHYSFLHAGQHKIDGHPHAPLTAHVADDIQADIDDLHSQFVELVAKFRRLSPAAVRATEARVYRGEAAIAAGLADKIGTSREVLSALSHQLAAQASKTAVQAAPRITHARSQQEIAMQEPSTDTPADDAPDTPVAPPDQSLPTPPPDADVTAAITAQVEARLRSQMAAMTEIAAQAKRLGVAVDPAQALARGVTPDALRQSVLKQAAERDEACDIVAHATAQTGSSTSSSTQSVAASPLVKAAQAYGGKQQ